VPPKIRGASTRVVRRVAVPATFAELDTIVDATPDRLSLFIVLAAFAGLREGELLEMRRSKIDGVASRISVTTTWARMSRPSTASREEGCPRLMFLGVRGNPRQPMTVRDNRGQSLPNQPERIP
jgi:integrase